MTLKALILLILLSRTPHHMDTETWDEREERMTIIANSVMFAADWATCTDQPAEEECKPIWGRSRKELAFLLVTQAIFESTLAQHVHENRCRLELTECDAARKWDKATEKYVYRQKAFSLWQLQRFRDIPMKHWKFISSGVGGTRAAAWYAARRLSSAYGACRTLEGAVSRYAKGHDCWWVFDGKDKAKERIDVMRKLMVTSVATLKKRRDRIKKRMTPPEETEGREIVAAN